MKRKITNKKKQKKKKLEIWLAVRFGDHNFFHVILYSCVVNFRWSKALAPVCLHCVDISRTKNAEGMGDTFCKVHWKRSPLLTLKLSKGFIKEKTRICSSNKNRDYSLTLPLSCNRKRLNYQERYKVKFTREKLVYVVHTESFTHGNLKSAKMLHFSTFKKNSFHVIYLKIEEMKIELRSEIFSV